MSQNYLPSAPGSQMGPSHVYPGQMSQPTHVYPGQMIQPSYPPTYTPLQIQPGQQLPIQAIPVNACSWGKLSQMSNCPFCRTTGYSQVRYERGLFTWASCISISILGCNAGCCLIPFCLDEFKDSYHYCQVCSSLLGIRKFLS